MVQKPVVFGQQTISHAQTIKFRKWFPIKLLLLWKYPDLGQEGSLVEKICSGYFRSTIISYRKRNPSCSALNTIENYPAMASEQYSYFISKEEWPPSSPDLNPLDFSLWSILESNTCAKCHKNIESLKKSLTEEWAKIPQQTMRTAVRSVPKRLRAVVKNLGGYIE